MELIKPSYNKKPDYVSGNNNSDYIFNCVTCKSKILVQLENYIGFNFNSDPVKMSKSEEKNLKEFYRIGISNKSHEGGFPVLDKISCSSCSAGYSIYLGISEPLNGCYHVQVQGIIKNQTLPN